MHYKIFQKIGLREPSHTKMTIQSTNRSIRHPSGVIEDAFVKVDKFIFPIDFVILVVEEGLEYSLILGWPFLAAS